MKNTRPLEITVGLFVSLGIAALVMLSLQVANVNTLGNADGYEVTAHFDNIGGLQVRAPVKMGGVVVGRVMSVGYDPQRFQAIVTMRIAREYDKIPTDTAANIYTAGLLGEQYVSLEPGGEETYLTGGSEITLTQSAVILERIVQEFIYSKTLKNPDKTQDK
jgi:phospholipid/cholesterol/gamma-HCH transport system substrate-binding protein